MNLQNYLIIPDWPAPANVKALQTTRHGGVSAAPYDTLNLGDHVGDAPLAVARNRMLLGPLLPSEPVWLKQVHGTAVIDAAAAGCGAVEADACISCEKGAVCVVMTADCLPVLLCDKQGSVVGAAHAGWKGLAAGVIEDTVQAMDVAPHDLMAWLGPAIGREAFEVGEEVRATFAAAHPQASSAFISSPLTPLDETTSHSTRLQTAAAKSLVIPQAGEGNKWLADIYALARIRLDALGITQIYGGNFCTFRECDKFFSYRRDGATGRMGTFIWLE